MKICDSYVFIDIPERNKRECRLCEQASKKANLLSEMPRCRQQGVSRQGALADEERAMQCKSNAPTFAMTFFRRMNESRSCEISR